MPGHATDGRAHTGRYGTRRVQLVAVGDRWHGEGHDTATGERWVGGAARLEDLASTAAAWLLRRIA